MQNRQRHPIPPRSSATQLQPHRAGHSIGIHPEEQPYWTDQRKKYSNPLDLAESLDYPGEPSRGKSSAIRYTDPSGNKVIRSGNRQLVIHDEPPPKRRKRPHWLVISGLSMIVVVLLWAILSWLVSWWTNNQLNATYEFPRISQGDAVVYPGDTPDHPSHYFFINLNGTVSIIEYVHGDPTHARVYKGPTLFADNAEQVPVTGEFRVVNNKIEMLVHIQDKIILYINNGTQFIPQ